jgi:hypothetical protein
LELKTRSHTWTIGKKKIVPLNPTNTNSIELEAQKMERYYTTEKLRALILNDGWDK